MAASETCSTCGEEVRYGYRDGVLAYWHRLEVDHVPIFGYVMTPEDHAEVERQRHLIRYLEDGTPYSTAEYEARKIKDTEKRAAALAELHDDEDGDGHDEIEPIEVRSIALPLKGRVFVGCPDGSVAVAAVPGGVRTVLNLAARVGWTVERLTYSRGPYLGSSGKSLGVSDTVVLVVRGPDVDGVPRRGVASWRDAKSDWAWRMENKQIERIGAKALIAWMKEVPSGIR